MRGERVKRDDKARVPKVSRTLETYQGEGRWVRGERVGVKRYVRARMLEAQEDCRDRFIVF